MSSPRPPIGRPPRSPYTPRHEEPKQALSHTGGETWVAGDPDTAEILAHALDTAEVPRDRLTHGFHSYPARMHWATAERVLSALDLDEGVHVLDPFCGSGTVLVEARVRGYAASGVDLNPLAIELARLKCDPLSAELREQLTRTASEVRELSEARVRARTPVHANLGTLETRWYEPHVLKEMAGLLKEIDSVEHAAIRKALRMVFSSLIVKFSRQRSDTAEMSVEKRVRKGLVSEFFERKAQELSERLEDLEQEARGPRPRVVEGDARRLRDLLDRPVDLIVTSPPYGGTYDYVAHHQRRFAWLGIDSYLFASGEIGARRHGDAGARFEREFAAAMRSMHDVMRPGAFLVMLMGDAQHGEERMSADELVAGIGHDVGFEPIAVATQARPEFRAGPERNEHLMALRRL